MADGTEWDKRYRESEMLWISEPDQALVEYSQGLDPGRALDLGAGEGRNSILLASKGWDVTAVDISQVALDRLEKVAEQNKVKVTTVLADLINVDLGGRTFDLVVLANIHPLPSDRGTIYRGAADKVALGGHLFLIGHHLDGLGIAGPPYPERLLTEERVGGYFPDFDIIFLGKRLEKADSGHHDAPSLVLWASRIA